MHPSDHMRQLSQLGLYTRILASFYLAVTCSVVSAEEEGAERVVLQLKWSHQWIRLCGSCIENNKALMDIIGNSKHGAQSN